MATDASFVRAEDLHVTYRRGPLVVPVLKGLDLEIPQGQFVCVLAPSGAGKTTLLQALAGLIRPERGQVHVGDMEVSALDEDGASRFRRRNIGIIFQFFNLSRLLPIEENVALPLLLDGVSMRELRPRVAEVIERLGIPVSGRASIDQLSGGELQRLAIARALLVRPRLLLADEPTGNLDTARGETVLRMLASLAHDEHITTALMTHDLRATSYVDRVLYLKDGRITEHLPSSPTPIPTPTGALSP